MFVYGPADATTIPKLHILVPCLNPDWFYLSGTGLPRLSWKQAVKWVYRSSSLCCVIIGLSVCLSVYVI